jgi:hypothetical protein
VPEVPALLPLVPDPLVPEVPALLPLVPDPLVPEVPALLPLVPLLAVPVWHSEPLDASTTNDATASRQGGELLAVCAIA